MARPAGGARWLAGAARVGRRARPAPAGGAARTAAPGRPEAVRGRGRGRGHYFGRLPWRHDTVLHVLAVRRGRRRGSRGRRTPERRTGRVRRIVAEPRLLLDPRRARRLARGTADRVRAGRVGVPRPAARTAAGRPRLARPAGPPAR